MTIGRADLTAAWFSAGWTSEFGGIEDPNETDEPLASSDLFPNVDFSPSGHIGLDIATQWLDCGPAHPDRSPHLRC